MFYIIIEKRAPEARGSKKGKAMKEEGPHQPHFRKLEQPKEYLTPPFGSTGGPRHRRERKREESERNLTILGRPTARKGPNSIEDRVIHMRSTGVENCRSPYPIKSMMGPRDRKGSERKKEWKGNARRKGEAERRRKRARAEGESMRCSEARARA